jgi:small-conductance mechanosensitive channel
MDLTLVLQAAAQAPPPATPLASRLGDPTAWIRAGFLVFLGLPLVFGLSKVVRGWVVRNSTAQRGMVVGKLLFYVGAGVIVVSALAELGFRLGPLLGAAGVLGVAIGFASQTSVSNVISGFFLMAEQPFVVDDIIQVGNTTGQVLSIDMMSVKLRTFDNRFVRIPNETIVKSEVTTVTRFPIRRLDMRVGVSYDEDIGSVRRVLLDVADRNPMALMDPEPLVIFQGYGESSVDLEFGVWTTRENFGELRDTLPEQIKRRFDEEGIEIPFPHRTVQIAPGSGAMPVRVVSGDDGTTAPSSSGDEERQGVD